jgi:ATP-dependent exoDNAse (exonuclease V) alpha subunit
MHEDELASAIQDASPEHKFAFEEFNEGKNMLLTGLAGTGKTSLAKQLIFYARNHRKNVLVAGTTGVSALLMNGTTVHSLIGLRPDELDLAMLVRKYDAQMKRYFAKPRKTKIAELADRSLQRIEDIRQADILVIDECSMLSAWLLEVLDLVFRIFRGKDAFLGGVQTMFVGDFRQLAPVASKQIPHASLPCFLSFVWRELNVSLCVLRKVFRQDNADFYNLIARVGMDAVLYSDQKKMLDSRRDQPVERDAVQIMIKNDDVRQVNESRYAQLITEESVYDFPLRQTCQTSQEDVLDDLLVNVRDCLLINKQDAEQIQKFRCGARVMLRMNLKSLGLVNGHMGTITRFETREDQKWPIVQFDHGVTHVIEPFVFERNEYRFENGSYTQRCVASVVALPLTLSWAMTVHKVQGQTLANCDVVIDCKHMDWMQATFYVALSRVANLNQVCLRNFAHKYQPNRFALTFYSNDCEPVENKTYLDCLRSILMCNSNKKVK